MGQLNASTAASNGEDLVVLIAGSDPIGDGVCTALSARGADVQQLSAALAVDAIATSIPDVVFLVGDAARQRGALIRSQLVRRMRGTELNVVVLTDNEATQSPNSSLRMIPRTIGAETIADQLMTLAESSRASRTKGTLDQVATMVTRALERPSQPAPAAAAAPSHIVMESARPAAAAPRHTIRVPGAIPAPARTLTTPPRKTSEAQLSLAPPTSLQAIAARRIEITKISNPPPLPEATEVSLADVRIETDRISGEVSLQRVSAPPLPVSVATDARPAEPSRARSAVTMGTTPTPAAWSVDDYDVELRVRPRSAFSGRARWTAALAVAACGGLIAWSALRSDNTTTASTSLLAQTDGTQHDVVNAPAGATSAGVAPTVATTHPHAATDANAHAAHEGDALAAAGVLSEDVGDEEDPEGDEPHLVRARQLCNEGHALRTRGRLGLAEAKYLQALGLFPQYPRAVSGVVRVHLTRGDGAEAVRWAERLVAMQPNRSNNQLLLGDAYSLSGKASEARRHWRKSASFGNMAARKRLKSDEPALAKPTR